MSTKEITDIVAKYFEKPKSNMQVLEDQQLNVLFEHITQHNQIASLEQVFAAAPTQQKQEAAPAEAAPKKEAAPQPRPQQNNPGDSFDDIMSILRQRKPRNDFGNGRR